MATSFLRVMFGAALVYGIVLQILRWSAATQAVRLRRQIEWVALGLIVGLTPYVTLVLLAGWLGIGFEPFVWLAVFPIAAVPLAILAALTEYRLWDLEPITRDILSATLVVVVGGIIFSLTDHLLQRYAGGLGSVRNLFAFATGVLLVVLLQPVRLRVERFLDQWLHHGRPAPRSLLTHSVRDLARLTDPRELLDPSLRDPPRGSGRGPGGDLPADRRRQFRPGRGHRGRPAREVPFRVVGHRVSPRDRDFTPDRGLHPADPARAGRYDPRPALPGPAARGLPPRHRGAGGGGGVRGPGRGRAGERPLPGRPAAAGRGVPDPARQHPADHRVVGGGDPGLRRRRPDPVGQLRGGRDLRSRGAGAGGPGRFTRWCSCPRAWQRQPAAARRQRRGAAPGPSRRAESSWRCRCSSSTPAASTVGWWCSRTSPSCATCRTGCASRSGWRPSGGLTSGLAHEINTPLTGIASFAQMLGEMTAGRRPPGLLGVASWSTRASECRRIVANLHEAVRGSRESRSADRPRRGGGSGRRRTPRGPSVRPTGCELTGLATRVMVWGGPGPVELAVSNLVRNAIEASPEGSPVTVEVAVDGGWALHAGSVTGVRV